MKYLIEFDFYNISYASTSGSSHLQVAALGANIYNYSHLPSSARRTASTYSATCFQGPSLPGVKQVGGHHPMLGAEGCYKSPPGDEEHTNLHQLLPILIRSWRNSLPRDRSCNQSHQEIWDPYHSPPGAPATLCQEMRHSLPGDAPLSARRCATLRQEIRHSPPGDTPLPARRYATPRQEIRHSPPGDTPLPARRYATPRQEILHSLPGRAPTTLHQEIRAFTYEHLHSP